MIALPPVFGLNWKAQVDLPFSPAGTQYGSRYPVYQLTFQPTDERIAVIIWDFLYQAEGGAIRFYTMGNITLAAMDFTITSDLVRLGVQSVRGNLPHYCKEHPVVAYVRNLTSYEVDLVITAPCVLVPKEVAEKMLQERVI